MNTKHDQHKHMGGADDEETSEGKVRGGKVAQNGKVKEARCFR